MTKFDFITDESFRTSLENDYREMLESLKSGCWKATHVLAGSITEAILINHLISENLASTTEALKMDFGKALDTCRSHNIISSKIADLSSVIKGYRNLIHPGRLIRLNETVDHNSADVAKALVEMVIEEIERKRQENYGYTAEQIVSKFKRDSSADAIIVNLLKQTPTAEKERLLLKILPNTYLEASDDPTTPYHVFVSLEQCFNLCFDLVSDDTRKRVIQHFARIIKEESELIVNTYGTGFFKCSYLKYASPDDIDLIKKHLLKRLSTNISPALLSTLEGIGKFLSATDATKFTDSLIRVMHKTSDSTLSLAIESRLSHEWTVSSIEIDKIITSRVNDWIKYYQERNIQPLADRLNNLSDSHDIPF